MKNGIKNWLIIANEDILTVIDLMKCNTIHTTAIAFYCQQAIEKYFKSFLLENDWQLQKIHDLIKLYGYVKSIKDLKLDEDIYYN